MIKIKNRKSVQRNLVFARIKVAAATLVLVFVSIPTFVSAAGGGWTGNGGLHSLKDQDNPWFLGEQSIPYCIANGPKTPFATPALNKMIQIGFSKWSDFFESYGIAKNYLGMREIGRFQFKDGVPRRITLSGILKAKSECDQITAACLTQDKDQECANALNGTVLFLFDKPNTVVKKFLDQRHGFGAAVRTSYDHVNYRTGGIVWINYTQPSWDPFQHIILHEMGHMFGLKHDSTWVMASQIAEFLPKMKNDPVYFLGQIESPHWSFAPKQGNKILMTPFDYEAGGSTIKEHIPNTHIPASVRAVLGLSTEGFTRIEFSLGATQNDKTEMILKFSDLSSSRDLTLKGHIKSLDKNRSREQSISLFSEFLYQGERDLKPYPISVEQAFDRSLSSWRKIGTLRLGDQIVAVNLEQTSGINLSLLLPGQDDWWIIRGASKINSGNYYLPNFLQY